MSDIWKAWIEWNNFSKPVFDVSFVSMQEEHEKRKD